jgi:hypothetical protein
MLSCGPKAALRTFIAMSGISLEIDIAVTVV